MSEASGLPIDVPKLLSETARALCRALAELLPELDSNWWDESVA